MPKPDYSTWLTKQQAADAIGVSTKLIEKFAQEKHLQSAKWKRPEGGARIAVYHPHDVERLRKERNPEAQPFVIAPSKDGAPDDVPAFAEAPAATSAPNTALAVRQPSAEQFLQAIAAAMGSGSQTSQNLGVRISERLFLTIPESADYSGLPQSHLRRLMADGTLKAMRTGGGWRIRRADLEKL